MWQSLYSSDRTTQSIKKGLPYGSLFLQQSVQRTARLQNKSSCSCLVVTKHKLLHRSSRRLRKFRSAASVRSSSFRSSFSRQSAAAVCFSSSSGHLASDFSASAYLFQMSLYCLYLPRSFVLFQGMKPPSRPASMRACICAFISFSP